MRTFTALPRPVKVALVAAVSLAAALLVRHWVHESEDRATQRTQDLIAACIRREQASNAAPRVSGLTIAKCKREAGIA